MASQVLLINSLVLSAGIHFVLCGCELLFAVGASIVSLVILSAYFVSGTEPGFGVTSGNSAALEQLVVLCFVTLCWS